MVGPISKLVDPSKTKPQALRIGLALTGLLVLVPESASAASCPSSCQPLLSLPSGQLPVQPSDSNKPSSPPDVRITDCRTVSSGTYTYGYVNVTDGGTLCFLDGGDAIEFYAKSILIEQGGTLQAGSFSDPFSSDLTIGLWGAGPTDIATDPNPSYSPISCVGQSTAGQCYPSARVGMCCTGTDPDDPCQATCTADTMNAFFEGYDNASKGSKPSLKLPYDDSYFGYKVLAVSYGGSLQLFGAKGVSGADRTDPASDDPAGCSVPAAADQSKVQAWADGSGNSWARLNSTADSGGDTLVLDRDVDWEDQDQLVVATTDWHPSHSELVSIGSYDSSTQTVTLSSALQYEHRGGTYTIDSTNLSHNPNNPNMEVDIRGAVGLLSRNITVRSMGSSYNQSSGVPADFPASSQCGCPTSTTCVDNPDCYFGGHVIVRQGFADFQVQGVEFLQLGQGGRMAHYPVHFHLAKDTQYTNAFLKDSSIWDSNTRFAVLHATHGVNLARNVGYLSMGHGYYIEDGSEIDNLLCYNLGVSARASLNEYFAAQSPPTSPTYRYIPPILNAVDGTNSLVGSDSLFPTMFWMMNAQNDFVGNKAAGVHGVGTCYWPLSSSVSGPSQSMTWAAASYADYNQAGAVQAPLLRFRGNSCTTAAYAFQTERASIPPDSASLISGLFTIAQNPYSVTGAMEPTLESNFMATKLGVAPCTPMDEDSNAQACVTTILDHFTSSFNWAQTNFGSVWLRPFNYIFSNSALTDQLYGGLAFISGGSPEQVIPQRLTISFDSVFVGSTDPTASDASTMGPDISGVDCTGAYCGLISDGVPLYTGAFNPKRLITIYDGPFYADGSIFDAEPVECDPWSNSPSCGLYKITNQPWVAKSTGHPNGQSKIINAGVGWKQPNGFYYPPVFAFRNTGFVSSSERHNVFDLYQPYVQATVPSGQPITGMLTGPQFGGVTPIDFTTILNDFDGTLNGLKPATGTPRSSGLSNNHFYNAPFGVGECNSFGTQTLPFEFVTTGVAQMTAPAPSNTDPSWTGGVPAVPIYRQFMLPGQAEACTTTSSICQAGGQWGCQRGTFLMSSQIGQALGLTIRSGQYYLDTNPQDSSCATARTPYQNASFTAGNTYLVYNLFPNSETQTTYQIYVGTGFSVGSDFQWVRVLPHATGTASYQVALDTNSLPAPAAPSNGVLTVSLDNSLIASDFGYQSSDPTRCQPLDVCRPDDTNQRCTRSDSFTESGLTDQIEEICQNWQTYANVQSSDGIYLDDCPANGCLGFTFTLPSGFQPVSYQTAGLPLALCYPDNSTWNRPMIRSDNDNCPLPAGQDSSGKTTSNYKSLYFCSNKGEPSEPTGGVERGRALQLTSRHRFRRMSMTRELQRRDFLKLTGTGLATMTTMGSVVSRVTGSPFSGTYVKKCLKFSMVKEENLSILQKFQMLKELGFDGVEMDSPSPLDRDEVIRARDESGLEIPGVIDSVHWRKTLSDPDPQIRAEGLAGLKTAISDARAYGASTALLVPAVVNKQVSYDDAYRRSQAEIRRAIPFAKKNGVKIAIENVWNGFLLSPLEMARYIDEFESPWVGAYFDVGNIVNYGWPEQWIRILGHRVLKLDIKEYSRKQRDEAGPRAGFRVKLGEGDCDWPAVKAAVADIGYRGWGSAEVPGGDRERLQEISLRMDKILAK